MRVVGIDPGKSGGLCILDNELIMNLIPMPLNSDGDIDFGEIARFLECWHPKVVYIEKVGARPHQGVTSMFNFGFGTGGLYGICATLKLPVVNVSPQTWQKFLMGKEKGVPHTKEKTIEFCMNIFPDVNLKASARCRNAHDGMADALAIATYAMMKESEEK